MTLLTESCLGSSLNTEQRGYGKSTNLDANDTSLFSGLALGLGLR